MTATPHRIRTTLTTIRALTAAVDTRLGPTLTRLTVELNTADGYPDHTSCSGSTAIPAPFIPSGENASTSSTERAAIGPDERNPSDVRAIGARAVLDELLDYLLTAAQALEIVCRECDRHTPELSAVDLERIRCAYVPPGKIHNPKQPACTQWSDPARNDGLCCDHSLAASSNARRLREHRTRNGTR